MVVVEASSSLVSRCRFALVILSSSRFWAGAFSELGTAREEPVFRGLVRKGMMEGNGFGVLAKVLLWAKEEGNGFLKMVLCVFY